MRVTLQESLRARAQGPAAFGVGLLIAGIAGLIGSRLAQSQYNPAGMIVASFVGLGASLMLAGVAGILQGVEVARHVGHGCHEPMVNPWFDMVGCLGGAVLLLSVVGLVWGCKEALGMRHWTPYRGHYEGAQVVTGSSSGGVVGFTRRIAAEVYPNGKVLVGVDPEATYPTGAPGKVTTEGGIEAARPPAQGSVYTATWAEYTGKVETVDGKVRISGSWRGGTVPTQTLGTPYSGNPATFPTSSSEGTWQVDRVSRWPLPPVERKPASESGTPGG